MPTTISCLLLKLSKWNFAWTCMEWDGIVWRRLSRVLYETLKLLPIVQSETSGQMVIMHCFHNNFVINVDIELWSRIPCWRRPITSDWRVFKCVDAKEATWLSKNIWLVKQWLSGKMENTDSDILRLRLTSSLMWISNRDHVFRIGGIILHPTGMFSNVLMQKKRHESRTTSDLPKSDCSVHDRWRQRYHVYY